jgi:hypothetical protein
MLTHLMIALAFVAVGAVVGLLLDTSGWSVTTWPILGLLVSAPVIFRRSTRLSS